MADSAKVSPETKICPKCETEKPASDFWRQAKSPDGLQHRCKACFYQWRNEADERYMASGKHATKQRENHYRRKFGISVFEVDEMARAQGFRCLLCGGKSGKHGLHLDHDHQTGRVRGLLCHNCNRGIGYLRDDPDLVLAAAFYLLGGEFDGG